MSKCSFYNKDISSIRLSSFAKLDPEKTYLANWINEFKEELTQNGITLKPKFRFHDEWYYADGSRYICIPFYLADKNLSKKVKGKNLETEGHNKREFLKLLRHEFGHYIEAAYYTRKLNIRRKCFGWNPKYPKTYIPSRDPNSFVDHLPNHYAQSHPDEDFAETFAVFLRGPSYWNKKHKGTGALKKLITMGLILEVCKSKKAKKLSSFTYFPLKEDKRTISEFLKTIPAKEKTPDKKTKTKLSKISSELQNAFQINPLEAKYIAKHWLKNSPEYTLSLGSKPMFIHIKNILKNKSHHIQM